MRSSFWPSGFRRTAVVALAVLAVASTLTAQFLWTTHAANGTGGRGGTLPLIYGTNMSLYDTTDQVVNNPATQRRLEQAHMPIIRMPFRHSLPNAYEVRALQTIKHIGAIPLVIVHGATDPTALADDRHLIRLVQSVFGNSAVYVEYGNEADLAGIDVAHYVASWNQVVPHLKAMAPTYKFIGPVTAYDDIAYIATFDKTAKPRPDANSWHEYVCNPGDSDAYCMDHIVDWTVGIQQTNRAVRAAIGTTLPSMITEWNLDATPDPRYAEADFIHAWTARALSTLAANVPNGLVAAMQYCATNNPNFGLIDGTNHLTLEGQTFFQTLESSGSPAP